MIAVAGGILLAWVIINTIRAEEVGNTLRVLWRIAWVGGLIVLAIYLLLWAAVSIFE